LGQFDIIFSEGVLHHTDSVEQSIKALSQRLNKGGKFLFYVYVKKAPIREYTDDLIRDFLAPLGNEEAWQALEALTKLGKTLGELNIEIDVEEDIPYLGIEKGRYNLQRLFYYKICKAYYRPDYNIDEMNHINFDWFRPQNCYRHSPEEVQVFCSKAGLVMERLHVSESGITVIAVKP
jgi:arsenite methyltransferase